MAGLSIANKRLYVVLQPRLDLAGRRRVDDVDDGAAHDRGVGKTVQGSQVLRPRNAESDGQRQRRVTSHTGEEVGQAGGKLGAGAGDAGDAHAVDEAGSRSRDASDPLVVGAGGDEQDVIDACGATTGTQLRALFWRQVDDDQAVDARRGRLLDEGVDAEGEQRGWRSS